VPLIFFTFVVAVVGVLAYAVLDLTRSPANVAGTDGDEEGLLEAAS
jgi:hypothetical protein